MSSLTIAFVVGVLIAVSGMAGLTLQRLLPDGHTAERVAADIHKRLLGRAPEAIEEAAEANGSRQAVVGHA